MKPYSCLVADDEPLAITILEKYIVQIDFLTLVGKCSNSMEVLAFINSNEVDILFLDIQMPGLSGIQLLKTLKKSPMVILTTAFSNYAVESYEFGVVDYLLKPISFERFIKSINKVINTKGNQTTHNSESIQKQNETLFYKEKGIVKSINLNDVLFFSANGNYINIHLAENQILISETMKNLESQVQSKQFIRIHKSYTVNISAIQKIIGNTVYIMKYELPIGETFKQSVLTKLNIRK